jgi:hypothetical protein
VPQIDEAIRPESAAPAGACDVGWGVGRRRALHVGQHDVPFGCVYDLGKGNHYGKQGFETRSKLRSDFYRACFHSTFMMVPYGKLADRLLVLLMR